MNTTGQEGQLGNLTESANATTRGGPQASAMPMPSSNQTASNATAAGTPSNQTQANASSKTYMWHQKKKGESLSTVLEKEKGFFTE